MGHICGDVKQQICLFSYCTAMRGFCSDVRLQKQQEKNGGKLLCITILVLYMELKIRP